jgi:hypothetical protein
MNPSRRWASPRERRRSVNDTRESHATTGGNTLPGWGAGVAEVSRAGGWDGVLDPEEGVGGGGASG